MLAETGLGAEFAEVVNLMLVASQDITSVVGRLKQRGAVLTSYSMQFPKNTNAEMRASKSVMMSG